MANGRGNPRGRSKKARAPVTMFLDTSSLNDLIDQLADQAIDAIRPAAQAGAQVFYDEVKRNVSRLKGRQGEGKSLANAIYQVYSKSESTPTKAVYHISWNPAKAPHAWLVEFGHIQSFVQYERADGKWITDKTRPITPRQVAARPYIRPAVSKSPQALAAMRAELERRIAEAQQ